MLQSHGSCLADAFVARLAADGQSLEWATYLGGEPVFGEIARGTDEGKEIAVTGDGDVMVVGTTRSSNFPVTPGAADVTFDGAWSDGFVARLSADGSTLQWATYLGGDYLEEGEGIVIGPGDRPMVVGKTMSKDFPTTAAPTTRSATAPPRSTATRTGMASSPSSPPMGAARALVLPWRPAIRRGVRDRPRR